MAVLSDYASGTITVTQGSIEFTGTNTLWRTVGFREGDTVQLQGFTAIIKGTSEPGNPITSNVAGEFTEPWPGTSGTFSYRMRFLPDGARITGKSATLIELLGNGVLSNIAEIPVEEDTLLIGDTSGRYTPIKKSSLINGVKYDAVSNDLPGLSLYAARPENFSVLVSDVGDGRSAVYVKISDTIGDWSDPAFVTGPLGPASDIEVGTTTTLPAGSSATVTQTSTPTGISLDFGIPLSDLSQDSKDELESAVTDANAAADRAASYTPNSVSRSISGLVPYNDVVAPLTTIGVSPGTARNSTNDVDIVLLSGSLKRINTLWAAGSGQGGLDTGAAAAFASYHLFVIRNPTSSAVDILISASATSPVLPSGFTQFRRIAALKTNANSQIYSGVWYSNGEFAFGPPPEHSMPSPSSVSLWSSFGPSGIKSKVKYAVNATDSASGNPGFALVFRDPALGIPTTFGQYAAWKPEGFQTTEILEAWTDTLGRVYAGGLFSRATSSYSRSYILGWTDFRDEFA